MIPISLIPLPWKIGAALALSGAVIAGAAAYHHHVYQQGFDAATSDRAARDGLAVLARVKENTAIGIKQDAINAFITKDHDEKLAPVVAAIRTDRVRIGKAICDRLAAATEAKSTDGSDAADTARRLVQSNLERDIRALEIRVEEALAAGRACQEFVKENGMAP